MRSSDRYRVLILGDFHYGESYIGEGARMLTENSYSHSSEHLRPFADACDAFVVNLETPLLDPTRVRSPLKGKKTYIHWGDPQKTLAELQGLGVDAVSLANNHTLDYGAEGLKETFQTLAGSGVEWFGAGRNLAEARAPYRLPLPDHLGGGELHFHGGYQYSTRSDVDYHFYAGEDTSGCAPLKSFAIPSARDNSVRDDSFQIAFPHWGANYVWRGPGQYRMAHRFLRKDYDLVLGHGGHCLQEVHRKLQRWVVYGLGNGMFNSAGRWHRFEDANKILPFSFWAVLEVYRQGAQRFVELKLYPVYSNNLMTNYQPGPVSTTDFEKLVQTLTARPARPWRFTNSAQSTGTDALGHFIALDLGEWPGGKRPSRLEPELSSGDPGDWPLRGPSPETEDRVMSTAKNLGPSMLAMPAAAEGGDVRWLSPKLALLESRGKRLLAHTYRAHESALGGSIVKDKVLTAEILEANGVATPKTVLVGSTEEAVEAAAEIPGPVVIKPRNGNKSRGVSTGLVDDQEIRAAFTFARKHGAQVILQQHINFSEELRIMASSDEALAVNGRVLPHVVGDGISTVRQLIKDKNLQRTLNPSLRGRPIPVDALTHRQLKREGISLSSVLNLGQRVTVRDVAGLSVGGDTFQNLSNTSEHLKTAASDAIAAIPGLAWGGVDLIIEKGTGRPFVIEINHSAAYGAAMFPAYGEPRDVGADVWKRRYTATRAERTGVPEVAKLLPSPAPVDPAIPEGRQATFEELFQRSLPRQDFIVTARNSRVLQVTGADGGSYWATKSGLTTADRSAVQQVIQRHSWVYELLGIAGVPRPRANLVSTKRELTQFVKDRVSRVHLAPAISSWSDLSSRILTDEEALSKVSLPKSMWAQTRLRGRRIRFLATQDKAWVATAKNSRSQLEAKHMVSAGQLAVKAVRAVPELRWACVDVLVRPSRIRAGLTDGLLVEGLTLAPKYSTGDRIIAGNIDDFFLSVLTDSDKVTSPARA